MLYDTTAIITVVPFIESYLDVICIFDQAFGIIVLYNTTAIITVAVYFHNAKLLEKGMLETTQLQFSTTQR